MTFVSCCSLSICTSSNNSEEPILVVNSRFDPVYMQVAKGLQSRYSYITYLSSVQVAIGLQMANSSNPIKA